MLPVSRGTAPWNQAWTVTKLEASNATNFTYSWHSLPCPRREETALTEGCCGPISGCWISAAQFCCLCRDLMNGTQKMRQKTRNALPLLKGGDTKDVLPLYTTVLEKETSSFQNLAPDSKAATVWRPWWDELHKSLTAFVKTRQWVRPKVHFSASLQWTHHLSQRLPGLFHLHSVKILVPKPYSWKHAASLGEGSRKMHCSCLKACCSSFTCSICRNWDGIAWERLVAAGSFLTGQASNAKTGHCCHWHTYLTMLDNTVPCFLAGRDTAVHWMPKKGPKAAVTWASG